MYTISFFSQKSKVEIDTSANIVYNRETFIHREGAFAIRIIQNRRALHQIPELDRQLPETIEYLRSELEGLGCGLFSPIDGSLCAWFDFGCESAIAFRADMDALPIDEKTALPTPPGIPDGCTPAATTATWRFFWSLAAV